MYIVGGNQNRGGTNLSKGIEEKYGGRSNDERWRHVCRVEKCTNPLQPRDIGIQIDTTRPFIGRIHRYAGDLDTYIGVWAGEQHGCIAAVVGAEYHDIPRL